MRVAGIPFSTIMLFVGVAAGTMAVLVGVLNGWTPFWTLARDKWRAYEKWANDELRSLYQGATAFVFPSLYEGFGLPVVEAFASGTPVIASTGTSLPEIVGDAGCLVDALDVGAIGAALERVVDDPAWADALRVKGRERAKRYSWDACASLTATVLREMA